jgi:anti-sigma B factor antagonist
MACAMDPETFSLSRKSLPGCELLTLEGELDLAAAPAVTEAVDALADPSRPLVIDLTGLRFIDSSGIHALVHPPGPQGTVVFVCPPGNIRRVLEMTRIDRVIRVFDTLDAALAEYETE